MERVVGGSEIEGERNRSKKKERKEEEFRHRPILQLSFRFPSFYFSFSLPSAFPRHIFYFLVFFYLFYRAWFKRK